MIKLILIITFLISTSYGFGQSDSLLINIKAKRIDKVEQSLDTSYLFLALQGDISDPIICNELGLQIITGTEIPNFGLSIDYNPLFLKRFIGQIEYRTDFNNQIFAASVESKFWINKNRKHLDFKLNYNRFLIDNTSLKDFQKLSFGPICRVSWTSIGCFIGQDSYEKQIGLDIYFKYQFHKLISGSDNEYKSKVVWQSLIGLWDKKMTYDLNLEYLINFNFSCGFGYKKLYDFDEIYFTFRYLLCY